MGGVPPVLMSSRSRHSDFSWVASPDGLDSDDEVVGLRLKVTCARRARLIRDAVG